MQSGSRQPVSSQARIASRTARLPSRTPLSLHVARIRARLRWTSALSGAIRAIAANSTTACAKFRRCFEIKARQILGMSIFRIDPDGSVKSAIARSSFRCLRHSFPLRHVEPGVVRLQLEGGFIVGHGLVVASLGRPGGRP